MDKIFSFNNIITKEKFEKIVFEEASKIKRLKVKVDNQFVYGIVYSVSGLNTYRFILDFNDGGTITGNCTIVENENPDSEVASIFADRLVGLITACFPNFKDHCSTCVGCNAELDEQIGFDENLPYFDCEICGTRNMNPNVYSGEKFPDVYWYCDECESLLNVQKGFNDRSGKWRCAKCGFINSIDEDHLD